MNPGNPTSLVTQTDSGVCYNGYCIFTKHHLYVRGVGFLGSILHWHSPRLVFVDLISLDVCPALAQQASYFMITKLGLRLQRGIILVVEEINFCMIVQ